MTLLLNSQKKYAFVIASLLYSQVSGAETEFNTDVLDVADRAKIDLSKFSDANYVMPGTYLLDIIVNQKTLPQRSILYIPTADNKSSTVCLPPDLISTLALREDVAKKITLWHDDQCADISAISGATVANNIGDGALKITVPQTWMKYADPNWTPPEQWDNGIAGLLLDYSVSGQLNKLSNTNDPSHSVSSFGTLGANLSAWRLRADYQSTLNGSQGAWDANFDWSQIYAYRPLPMQAAKLTVGEMFLDSNVFDSYRFTGVNLASDERMLPPDLQGYAPEVKGIAKSNAKVTVSQDGRVLHQTTVPAGPFTITNISSGVRGRLQVKVEEQDGSVSTFQVDTATIPYLTRPGHVRYNVSVGQPSTFEHQLQGPLFSSSDFSWGVSNAWSLYGGSVLAGDYNAGSLGLGRDLSVLGALSADVTQSFARLPDEPELSGMSFRLNYAKRFDDLDSQISFAGYRFSQDDFMSMSQYLQERYNDSDDQDPGREKELYTVAASKTFMAQDSSKAFTAYLTYSHQTFWDHREQDRYGVSASKIFDVRDIHNVTTSVSAFRSENQGISEDSVMLNLTIPVGERRSVGYTLQTNNSDVTHLMTYNDYTDANNSWQASSGVNQHNDALARGYYTHNTGFGSVSANAAYQQDSFASVGGTFRSGITATKHGVAAHQNSGNGNTRLMIDTDGVAGVPISNSAATSNRFGVAVLSNVTSYYNTDTRIDVNKLAADVEATRPVVQGTLTEGAIGYRSFDVVQGNKLLANIKLADGSTPPFGATVVNKKGQDRAVVSDDGSAYLTGVKADETLDVVWEGKRQCQIVIPASAGSLEQLLLPCKAA